MTEEVHSWTRRSCDCLHKIKSVNIQTCMTRAQKPHQQAEELLANDGCYPRESQFSLGVWCLLGWPANCSRWSHTHKYRGSTSLTQWGIKKSHEGEGWKGSKHIKHIAWNSQRKYKYVTKETCSRTQLCSQCSKTVHSSSFHQESW